MNPTPKQNRSIFEDNLFDFDKQQYFEFIQKFTFLYNCGVHQKGNQIDIKMSEDEFMHFMEHYCAYVKLCDFIVQDEIGNDMFQKLVLYMRLKE